MILYQLARIGAERVIAGAQEALPPLTPGSISWPVVPEMRRPLGPRNTWSEASADVGDVGGSGGTESRPQCFLCSWVWASSRWKRDAPAGIYVLM